VSFKIHVMAIILKQENVAQLVFLIREEKVMLDADLAMLYGVSTKALNQAFRRNRNRFPSDFVFQLTKTEFDAMRSQLVIGSPSSKSMRSQIVTASRRNISALPFAFTEQGVAMLSSVLRSARSVEVNIAIMRTFVQLRRLMDSNSGLARKIEGLERKYDEQFAVVFEAIKQLVSPPNSPSKKRIGFHSDEE
jgi:ORF6N domain